MHLVELRGTGQYFAMKAMDKGVMLNRNKVVIVNYKTFFLHIACILNSQHENISSLKQYIYIAVFLSVP